MSAPLRVAHVSTSDLGGGAARAAYRLHQGLTALGTGSAMVVQEKLSADGRVHAAGHRWVRDPMQTRGRLTYGPLRLYPRRDKAASFSLQWLPSPAPAALAALDPDVVNLHWVCGGFLSVEDVARITQPVVWTLHDMWAFTGGCHYSGGCRGFEQQCGRCPVLGSRTAADASRWVHRRKARAWRHPLRAVSPSRWLAEEARKSSLFAAAPVEVIPYGVDTELFAPQDRAAARHALGLPAGKKIILFGAARALDDPRKGFAHLVAALAALPPETRRDWMLAVAGAEARATALPLPVDFRGDVKDDHALARLYAAADVFVAPSVEENLSCMVLEALAAGTPCVAFDVGGMPDMIVHRETGYLARPYEAADLAAGLAWVLAEEERRRRLAAACRSRAEAEYSLRRQAERYLDVYRRARGE